MNNNFNRYFSFIIFCFSLFIIQVGKTQNTSIDILHYEFNISINDNNNKIEGATNCKVRLLESKDEIVLDLVSQDSLGKGMTVSEITINDNKTSFLQNQDLLYIKTNGKIKAGDTLNISIRYHGIPKDGLIISMNKYNSRTFFGDNWPNRAHHYLPTNDHPSDKATVSWVIQAPHHYKVIANGLLVERSYLNATHSTTRWESKTTIPTKVMVFGAANFSTSYLGKVGCVPVTAWVFNQNKEDGFSDYSPAVDVLNYYVDHIGEYPYYKLANVQSKTRYGGMENAGCIFYFENSVNGKSEVADLIAHEVVHQWFGNSVSETDWKHIWVSEGFATYLADLYMLHSQGNEVFEQRLQNEKKKAINFINKQPGPIIPTNITDINLLLNPNSYQRAAWVLHMFHNRVGDDLFWTTIQNYYNRFKNENASSADFIEVAENSTHLRLKSYFKQWLERDDYPILNIYLMKIGNSMKVDIIQKQKGEAYILEVPMNLIQNNKKEEIKISCKKKNTSYIIEDFGTNTTISFNGLNHLFCEWQVTKVE